MCDGDAACVKVAGMPARTQGSPLRGAALMEQCSGRMRVVKGLLERCVATVEALTLAPAANGLIFGYWMPKAIIALSH